MFLLVFAQAPEQRHPFSPDLRVCERHRSGMERFITWRRGRALVSSHVRARRSEDICWERTRLVFIPFDGPSIVHRRAARVPASSVEEG